MNPNYYKCQFCSKAESTIFIQIILYFYSIFGLFLKNHALSKKGTPKFVCMSPMMLQKLKYVGLHMYNYEKLQFWITICIQISKTTPTLHDL